jgi:hypothetical protein
MIVAIHQPNFLPWLGYFDKLARADVFVVLDTVAAQQTGSSYTNRVEVLVGGKRSWLTVPIARGTEARRRIADLRVVDSNPWRRKIRATIEQSYARAPFFAAIMPMIQALLERPGDKLADFNLAALTAIAELLRLDCRRIVLASTLGVPGAGTDLLIAIVRAVGGTTYLCGGGAGGYQDDAKFAAAGIALRYQNFRHPVYPQVNADTFVAGLSVVDALMNCGHEGVSGLLDAAAPAVRHAS